MRFCKAAPQGDVGTNFLKLEVFFLLGNRTFTVENSTFRKKLEFQRALSQVLFVITAHWSYG